MSNSIIISVKLKPCFLITRFIQNLMLELKLFMVLHLGSYYLQMWKIGRHFMCTTTLMHCVIVFSNEKFSPLFSCCYQFFIIQVMVKFQMQQSFYV
jgi:hypothetical protein